MTTLRETVARQFLRFAHSLGSILGEWDDIPPAVQQRLLEQAGYVLRALATCEPSEAVAKAALDDFFRPKDGRHGVSAHEAMRRSLKAALRAMAEKDS